MTVQGLLNIISLSILLIYIIPVILYVYTKQVIHLKILAGIGVTTILSEWLKYNVFKEASLRPKGAKDCNLLCNDGNQEGKPGMPSSHSAQVAFFAGIYYFQTTNPFVRLGLVAYEIAVILSRYLKRCHTIEQIGTGTILGLVLSRFFLSCVHKRA